MICQPRAREASGLSRQDPNLNEDEISPIHPAVVHLPIGLTLASVVADTAKVTGWSSLAIAGAWMLLGAALGGTLAVPAGHYDMKRDALKAQTHQLVDLHMRLGWAVALGLWALAAWRWIGQPSHPFTNVAYLIAAWILVGLIVFQGWFGGEMVYGHGAGVAPPDKVRSPPTRRRDARFGSIGWSRDERPAKTMRPRLFARLPPSQIRPVQGLVGRRRRRACPKRASTQ
jgi:uncharacterized membrane protein